MKSYRVFLLLVAFAGGMGCATLISYLGRQEKKQPVESINHPALSELKSQNAMLVRKNAQLKAAAKTTRVLDGANPQKSTLVRLATVTQLINDGILSGGVSCLDRRDKITRACIALFGLTLPEQEQLQQVINDARASTSALELQNSTVQILPDGSKQITVAAFAEEGGKVHDQLLKAVQNILGLERAAGFAALALPQIEMRMQSFGIGQRTLVVRPLPTQIDGQPAYGISEVIKGPNSTSRRTLEVFDLASLRAELGGIAKLAHEK